MPTVINTNLASLYAQNNLSNAQNNLALSVQRLSSGLRINSAKDDAAGLAISQNMQSQINGINQSVRNLNDATNLMQVADTSLGTIHEMLLRMKQLAVQGYDGSLSGKQRSNIVDELTELNAEITQTAVRTKFNNNALLSQTTSQDTTVANSLLTGYNPVGTNGAHTTTVTVTGVLINSTKAQAYTIAAVGTNGLRINGADGIGQTVTINDMVANSSQVLDFNVLGIKINLTNGASPIDDGAAAANKLGALVQGLATKVITVTGSNATMDFQSGPSSDYFIRYTAINMRTDASGTDTIMKNVGTMITASTATGDPQGGKGLAYLKSEQANTTNASNDNWSTAFLRLTSYIDTAIDRTSDQRSFIGAQMNRLSYVSTNLQSTSTNLQSSKSAMMDTDFAAETARLTKGQIMQQAATAMLAQANQMPNVVLSLLK
jgi:flagellin